MEYQSFLQSQLILVISVRRRVVVLLAPAMKREKRAAISVTLSRKNNVEDIAKIRIRRRRTTDDVYRDSYDLFGAASR